MASSVLRALILVIALSLFISSAECLTGDSIIEHSQSVDGGLCFNLIRPCGYTCLEHTAQTNDGFLLGLQRVSSGILNLEIQTAPPVLLLHGLFMGGDAWFMNSPNQSLGFILADRGFDVWVGNVRGTTWSHGLKQELKLWRAKINKLKSDQEGELKKKIVAIDTLAESILMDEDMLKERVECLSHLQNIEEATIMDLKQKARCKWLLEGDENTAFFHGLLKSNVRNNRVNGINVDGMWVSDPKLVKDKTFSFFKEKFRETLPSRPKFRSSKFRRLTNLDSDMLEVPFSPEEIKQAVWNCGNDKAPGPDGFNFSFIKTFWDIIGSDIVQAVQFFAEHKFINTGSNNSFITLVPKKKDPLNLSDYRPINLIGCITKIISKTLAIRLKAVIHKIIGNEQTAYIKGRNITEGPLILSEAISWAKRTKKKAFIFKADFEKAFDCLNWDYLDDILHQMGFGCTWRMWVRAIISAAKVSILVNGSPTNEFQMERGIRQGDPLSPFLFIIAAEGLRVAVEEAQEKGLFTGIKLPRDGPMISILQYADDTIFLGNWSMQNARNMKRILTCFYISSGLKINLQKCNIYGLCTGAQELSVMASSLNCRVGEFPFIYLGMPVGKSMNRISSWNPLVERFSRKLSSWKASTLSSGGRLVLCKSVLGSLGMFLFSLYKAPNKLLARLESIRNRFFWGSKDGERHITWVAWRSTLNSKERGGLSIGSLKAANVAMLMHWWWKFRENSDNIWKSVIKSLYGRSGKLDEHMPINLRSTVWGKICSLKDDLLAADLCAEDLFNYDQNGCRWSLEHNGNYTVKSLRKVLDDKLLQTAGPSTCWSNRVPSKINILVWRARLGRLPTKLNLIRREVAGITPLCPMCNSRDEDELHLFIRCSTATEVMARLKCWWDLLPNLMQTSNIDDLVLGHRGPDAVKYEVVVRAFMWVLWLHRNELVFKGQVKGVAQLVSEEFWDWSWEEMALYDLETMLSYINSKTSSKVFVVGHSQGTIMSLAAFTEPNIVNMVEAAALLSPISYLDHITSKFVLNLVHMYLDEVLGLLGMHQLNLKSDILINMIESACDNGNLDCSDMLASITGENCCFNSSRVDVYLEYEPHPSSVKNLKHLFQMIRKGTFARYDYGTIKNLLQYGKLKPPTFDLSKIPKSLPIWMAYGGNDALGDVIDVQHTLKELKSKPDVLFLEDYGHVDFLLSTRAYEDLYDNMINFFRSCGNGMSSSF